MKKKPPEVALIWMYRGKNAATRRAEIEAFDYPNYKVVDNIGDIPVNTDLCIFWMDDDKPVTANFIAEMTSPLIAGKEFRAVMHFWSGNAISIPKKMIDSAGVDSDRGTDKTNVQSLLKLLLPVLDVSDKNPASRLHLALSSTERLAPLSMEAVGFPS
jgi:hypothetical protein